jgi:deoxyribonuclease-4
LIFEKAKVIKMIKFGTAGVPLSASDSSTEAGIKRIRELGLDAMEVEFVHGVRMKEEKARLNGQTAIKEKVALTCHAPYYVNLNSKEEEKIVASKQRLVDTARAAEFLGAKSIIFHPAFYSGDESQQVFSKVLAEIAEIRSTLDKEDFLLYSDGNHQETIAV